jgi:hypothetical protein
MALVALAGIAGTWWSAAAERTGWMILVIALITLVGVLVQVPVWKRPAPDPERVTFRGDITNSRITNVYSEADTLFGGEVRESLVDRIRHRPKRGR